MMTSYDSSSQAKMGAPPDIPPSEQASADVAPPVGITPPQLLAQDAAAGRRGAAWRLLYWIMENDPRAVIAVSSIEDDRLAHHLLEFIAIGTWAGRFSLHWCNWVMQQFQLSWKQAQVIQPGRAGIACVPWVRLVMRELCQYW